MESKQVIVFRKDLLKGEHAIRKGKFGAQVAHASLASLLQCFSKKAIYSLTKNSENIEINQTNPVFEYSTSFMKDSVLDDWLNGKFTKIVVSVDTEEELLALNKALDETFLPHALITDCGLTEFNGVPTNTCLGIGPCNSEAIDKYTKSLSLL